MAESDFTSTLNSLAREFASQIASATEAAVIRQVNANLAAALGASVKRGPGRPRKNGLPPALPLMAAPATPRKATPKQLCPVPGCKNPAAPVFGMVCADHKDVPKAKVKKFREARRAAKVKRAPSARRGRKAA